MSNLWTLDRVLLGIYLIALIVLMMFPLSGPNTGYLGIGIDKWMHFLLFGGLAVFVRWNLRTIRGGIWKSIGAALVVAILTEVAQGLVSYRSAELMDIGAGLLGAMLGAVLMNRIVLAAAPEKPIGVMLGTVGLMVGGLFILADVIGIGSSEAFGAVQLAGTGIGVVILAAGVRLYLSGLRRETHR